jgi:hypothetical protein
MGGLRRAEGQIFVGVSIISLKYRPSSTCQMVDSVSSPRRVAKVVDQILAELRASSGVTVPWSDFHKQAIVIGALSTRALPTLIHFSTGV